MARTTDAMDQLVDAEQTYEEAARCLVEAVAKAFPIGKHVEIPRGNGVVRGTVRYNDPSWWSRPTRIGIVLDSTGKVFWCDVDPLIREARS